MGDQVTKLIFTSDSLLSLKKVDVSSNNITHEGIEFIAVNNKMKDLEVLDLRNNRIATEGFVELIKSTRF